MVLVVYAAECDVTAIVAGDDVSECVFFQKSEIPENLAFEGNRSAIRAWSAKRDHATDREAV